MKPPKQIEVLRLNALPAGCALKATADVRVGQITIRGIRLIRDPIGGFAVTGPQIVSSDNGGQRHYKTLVDFPKLWRNAIRDAVLTAYLAREIA